MNNSYTVWSEGRTPPSRRRWHEKD